MRLNFIHYLGFILAFFTNQRFTLEPINTYVCLIPLLMFFIWNKKHDFQFIFLSLFTIADKGAGAFLDTPSIIKYVIYSISLTYVFKNLKWEKYTLLIFQSLIVYYLNITIFNVGLIKLQYFSYDMITLIVLLLMFLVLVNKVNVDHICIDEKLLLYSSIGLMSSDVINMLFLYEYGSSYYLSFSPIRIFIYFPSLYFLVRGDKYKSGILFLIAFYLSIGYQTRMNFIVGTLCYFWLYFRMHPKSTTIILASLLLFFSVNLSVFSGYRIFDLLFLLNNYSNIVSLLESLDPVRFNEYRLYFSSELFNILFGHGLGIGIHDKSSILPLSILDSSAFSKEEISTSIYYKLHDALLYISKSYGLIAFVLLLSILLHFVRSQTYFHLTTRYTMLMLFLLASYSITSNIILLLLTITVQKASLGYRKYEN